VILHKMQKESYSTNRCDKGIQKKESYYTSYEKITHGVTVKHNMLSRYRQLERALIDPINNVKGLEIPGYINDII